MYGFNIVFFVTSNPRDTTREILEAMRDLPSVCEHLHMPAQSGSDRILSAMKRGYAAQHYRDARIMRIYAGTDEMQIRAIARDLLSR